MWPVGRRGASALPVNGTDRECPDGPPGPLTRPLQVALPREKSALRSGGPGWLAFNCRAGQGPRCLSRPAWRGKAALAAGSGKPEPVRQLDQGLVNRISGGLCTPPSRSLSFVLPPLAMLHCCNAAQSELWTATSDWSASARSLVKSHAFAMADEWESVFPAGPGYGCTPTQTHRPRTNSARRGQETQDHAGPRHAPVAIHKELQASLRETDFLRPLTSTLTITATTVVSITYAQLYLPAGLRPG